MRKTPRSSFMVRRGSMGDDATGTIVSPGGMSPPIVVPIVPTVAMPPTTAPAPVASSGLIQYVLWGGLAYLAYWLWSKE
jgi:hypothetical protein